MPASSPARVEIVSTLDQECQPAFFHAPGSSSGPVPLLVGLHTWAGDYTQDNGYLTQAAARGWAVIKPDFRGPNKRPEACASDLAVQDVLDAVDYACRNASVDKRRIYLAGVSGGGHMALVMAARAPQVWAGVSAWVPVSDLAAWHASLDGTPHAGYRANMEAVCGGRPDDPQAAAQYRKRSPLFSLPAAKGLPVDINAGIHDGHTGSVPVEHSLWAFNALAQANGHAGQQFAPEHIRAITASERIPEDLAQAVPQEPSRQHKVLLRRTAGPARITLFDGGHEMDLPVALDWLAGLQK